MGSALEETSKRRKNESKDALPADLPWAEGNNPPLPSSPSLLSLRPCSPRVSCSAPRLVFSCPLLPLVSTAANLRTPRAASLACLLRNRRSHAVRGFPGSQGPLDIGQLDMIRYYQPRLHTRKLYWIFLVLFLVFASRLVSCYGTKRSRCTTQAQQALAAAQLAHASAAYKNPPCDTRQRPEGRQYPDMCMGIVRPTLSYLDFFFRSPSLGLM